MKGKREKIILVLFCFACVILLMAGWLFYRLHNGVKIKPVSEYQVSENVIIYRQDDASWAQEQLGESKYTIGSSGCLVSCIAAAVTINGGEVDPGELNECFSANGVYDTEGNIQWENIDKLEGYGTEVFSDVTNEHVEKCLKEGKYPIVRVRMKGLGNIHYVLVVGAEDGEYICMDPLQDQLTRLKDYGNRIYAVRCVWYENQEKAPAGTDESEIEEAQKENNAKERKEAVLPQENKALYEAFLALEYAQADCIYAYDDFDDDGTQELLLKRNDNNDTTGYMLKCNQGGLQFIYQKEISKTDSGKMGLEWIPTMDDTASESEMTHTGIYVFVSQDEWDGTRFWYLDEASFIHGFGFDDTEPFYKYDDQDGAKRLILYYNEETEEGLGIRYYERDSTTFITSGMFGFTFSGVEEKEWEGSPTDYSRQISIEGGNGSSQVEDYAENYEYDSEGRVVHFDSKGRLTWLGGDDAEPSSVLWIDYEYDENGILKHRLYWHNTYVFGTSGCTWESYFDTLGRVEYEDLYITHGSLDDYYIYSDDSALPEYELILDNNVGTWIPEFIHWKADNK